MKWSRKGNQKLGTECVIISRPVGLTCPPSCPLLGNGCYAEKVEKFRPHARSAASENVRVSPDAIRAIVWDAIAQGKSIRIHERGEFMINGRLDVNYVKAWEEVLRELAHKVDIWTYTHVYHKRLANLAKLGLVIYASVHNEKDIKKAQAAGFTLFAWADEKKKPKKIEGRKQATPATLDLPILGKTRVCPEQRNHRSKVTCTGGKGTAACNICVKGTENIVFLRT